MTLITNPTRVHFADNVLQEALQSELEQAGFRKPLLIAEETVFEAELSDRIHAALPYLTRPSKLSFGRGDNLRTRVAALIEQAIDPDVIIAFGSARSIELGRKCRYALTQKYGKRPLLFAVPGVDGMPNPCTRNLETWRSGLPSILICDPTVALDASPGQLRNAVVISLVRCVESYLSTAFNPPADGMALDGLNRCIKSLPRTEDSGNLKLQREVMAAGLNAAFSQEKGIGPASILAAKLMETPIQGLDEAELSQLVLRGVLRSDGAEDEKVDTLRSVLGGNDDSLESAVNRVLNWTPQPRSLSDMGFEPPVLDAAAHDVAGHAGLNFESARVLLESAY